MAYLVKLSDFENAPYRVPNQTETPYFIDFVNAAEVKWLKRLLGYQLYTEFAAAIAGTPAQKWIDLRDGAVYTGDDGVQYEYKGLVDLLVPCIYSLWLRERRDKFTDAGVGYPVVANFERISPEVRIADAWNEFARKVGDDLNRRNTLYGFLYYATDGTYDNWVFEEPGFTNELGL